AGAEDAAQVIERADQGLRAARGDRPERAVAGRLQVLDGTVDGGRGLSGGMETDELRQTAAVRSRQRERRQGWAQRSGQDAAAAPAVSHTNRTSSAKPPPRTRR